MSNSIERKEMKIDSNNENRPISLKPIDIDEITEWLMNHKHLDEAYIRYPDILHDLHISPKIEWIELPNPYTGGDGFSSTDRDIDELEPQNHNGNTIYEHMNIENSGTITWAATDWRLCVFRIDSSMCKLKITIPGALIKSDSAPTALVAAYYTDDVFETKLNTGDARFESASYKCLSTKNIFLQMFRHITSNSSSEVINSYEYIGAVPQELFESGRTEAYLYVRLYGGDAGLKVIAQHVPSSYYLNKPPVAVSINSGEPIETSSILLGSVRAGEKEITGKFVWDTTENISTTINTAYATKRVRAVFEEDIEALPSMGSVRIESLLANLAELLKSKKLPEKERNILKSRIKPIIVRKYCTYIDVPIYNTVADSVSAFIWRSCGENPAANASLLDSDPPIKHHLNIYPRLHDAVSTYSVYGCYCALSLITGKTAAKILARELVKQPPGKRSLSIDGFLENLMRGVIGVCDDIKQNDEISDDNRSKSRILTSEEADSLRDKIHAFFGDAEGYLFFDSPVNYNDGKEPPHKNGINYKDLIRDGLGIEKGSSGCTRLCGILQDLFSELHSLGVDVDYVYCDIEHLNATAGELSTAHRMGTRPNSDKSAEDVEKEAGIKERWRKLFETTRFKKEIFPELRKRGYIADDDDPLYYVRKVHEAAKSSDEKPSDEKTSDAKPSYGISTDRSYAARRNLNIWDAVMRGYVNRLFDDYIWNPVLSNYPNAKCSALGHYPAAGYLNHAANFETYLGGTTCFDKQLYACPDIYGNYYSEGFGKLSMDNWKAVVGSMTQFSKLLGAVNLVRLSYLSHSGHKIAPFICSPYYWATQKSLQVLQSDEERQCFSYYKEMLYHTMLCAPDQTIVYINPRDGYVCAKRKPNEETNTRQISEVEYIRGAYEHLQSTLQHFSDILSASGMDKCAERIPVIDALANETEPFIITGMEIGEFRIWRITFDRYVAGAFSTDGQPVVNENVPEFRFRGKNVRFPGGSFVKKEDDGNLAFGYWIKTGKDSVPLVTSDDDYFFIYPAYSAKLADIAATEEAKDVTSIVETPDKYTVFGEFAYHKIWELELQFNASANIAHTILTNDIHPCFRVTETPKANTLLCELISGAKEAGSCTIYRDKKYIFKKDELIRRKDISCEEKCGDKTAKRCEKRGGDFECKSGISLYDAENDTCMLHYVENDFSCSPKVELPYDIEPTAEQEYPWHTTTLIASDLKQPLHQGNINEICNNTLKVYLAGTNTKLEIFRESDGLNISRVNKNVDVYADADVETDTADTLIAKFSWLNASNVDKEYCITISQYDLDGKPIEQNGVWGACVKVPKGDDGYTVFKLPALRKNTRLLHATFFDTENTPPDGAGTGNNIRIPIVEGIDKSDGSPKPLQKPIGPPQGRPFPKPIREPEPILPPPPPELPVRPPLMKK